MTVQPQLATARVERVLPAAPGDAYDAWLREDALRAFICPAPGRAASVSIDPRIGGQLRFLMAFPDHEIEVTGEYLALERPSHISFTWRCSDTGDLESIVSVVFAPYGNGETLMKITHSKQPAQLVEKHRGVELGRGSTPNRYRVSDVTASRVASLIGFRHNPACAGPNRPALLPTRASRQRQAGPRLARISRTR